MQGVQHQGLKGDEGVCCGVAAGFKVLRIADDVCVGGLMGLIPSPLSLLSLDAVVRYQYSCCFARLQP